MQKVNAFRVDKGCCYDNETKVLTHNGWKYFTEISIGDSVYSLTIDNRPVFETVEEIIKIPYKGVMDTYKSTQIDLCVTSNHNMWVYDYDKRAIGSRIWKFIVSERMNNGRYKFNKSSAGTLNDGYSHILIPGKYINRGFYKQYYEQLTLPANAFLELLGIWVTDGSVSLGKKKSGNKIIITQVKKKVRSRIIELLKLCDLKYTEYNMDFRVNCPQLFQWLLDNFIRGTDVKKSYYLKLPDWVFVDLSKDNMENLLKGIILGDGTPHTGAPNMGYQIYTASKTFSEDIARLCMLIGKASNIYEIQPRDRIFPHYGKPSKCVKSYVVSVCCTTEHLFNNKRLRGKQEYDGYVHCVTLKNNHRLFVMRNGKSCWCGSSNETTSFVLHHEVK